MSEQIDRLVPLDQLEGALTEEVLDVEGWHVVAADGTRLGEVIRVLVDAMAPASRFLEIGLADDVAVGRQDRHVLLALGDTRLFEEGETVLLPGVPGEDVPDRA